MALKKFSPTTPGRRQMTGYTFEEITRSKPNKRLTKSLRGGGSGRNSAGRITIQHRGGGHARRYRFIDFYCVDKKDIPAVVESIEYDPNRSSYIALVCYKDGERRYVLAHTKMKVGDEIITADTAKPVEGNRMKISNVPVGFPVYNVEALVGQGASMIRSAGSQAIIVSQEGEYTQLKLASGEIRLIHKQCFATIGQVSNIDHNQVVIGKAGRTRWMGRRPVVRGKAKNPVDHPHGGGEGRNSIGLKYPKTPWGKPALGVKTRRRKNTNGWILQTRK